MSYKAMGWASELREGLKPASKMVMMMLASEASSDDNAVYTGQEHLAWLSLMSVRSLRDQLRTLEQLGLIHRERRPRPEWMNGRGGRLTDAIVLHLDVDPGGHRYPRQDELDAKMRENARRYRAPLPTEPEGVSPSQAEPARSAGSSLNRQTTTFEPANSRQSTPGAIKRIARTDLTQSCPVLSSPEEEATAGAVETGPDMTGPDTNATSTTTEQAERGPSVAGVPVRLLRWKTRPVLDQVEDQVIEEMIRIVMSRYDAVRSPLGLMITAVRADDGQDLVEEAQARVAAASEEAWSAAWTNPATVDDAWAEIVREAHEQNTAEASRPRSCPTHNVDFVGPECPSCRADRLAGSHLASSEPATPHTPGGGVDGAELRRRLRAQRAARVGGDR